MHIGPLMDANLRDNVVSYAKTSGVKFCELGNCDYDVYRHILSQAEWASVTNFNNADNAKFAYPNRLFDCVSSLCPILTHGFEQVSEFVNLHNIGISIADFDDVSELRRAVENMSRDRKKYVENLLKIQGDFSWDDTADGVFKKIPKGAKVLIVSRKDLRKNIRIRQICRTLKEKKCEVTVIGGHRIDSDLQAKIKTVPFLRMLTIEEIISL